MIRKLNKSFEITTKVCKVCELDVYINLSNFAIRNIRMSLKYLKMAV
jgi:hypothetical protein